MTEFLPQYFQILLAMGLIFFITNEVVKLFDAIRILRVTRRVRQLTSQRSQAPTPRQYTKESKEIPEPPGWKPKAAIETVATQRAKIITAWPKINWWAVAGGILVLLIASMIYYIVGVYDPSGGR